MLTDPFFSIIIPTLNEEKYLLHILSDLTRQTFQDFEVVIVDGHSDDRTVKLAKNFTSKLPSLKVVNSAKRHVCIQRNLGAARARADTFIFMDADNRLPVYYLQGIKYHLEESGADVFTTRFQPDVLNSLNLAVANVLNLFLELQNTFKPSYLLEAMIVVNRRCFNAINGFDETSNYAEGKTFITSAVKKGFQSAYFRNPVYTYSFRRFRKYGVMGLASRTARMELYELLGLDPNHTKLTKLYPMKGGKLFDDSSHSQLLLKLQSRLKSVRARQNFLRRFEKIKSALLSE